MIVSKNKTSRFLALIACASALAYADYKQPFSSKQLTTAESDVLLTRNIRRELAGDKSISIYAKNVKIITRNGLVILRGSVKSEREKNIVIAAAKRYAGEQAVQSGLELKKGARHD